MRYFTILIFTTLWVLNSYAQEFGTHWVSYPFPNDSSEILYRKIYHLDQKPLKAEINMASGGNTRLYINERNATPSIFNEGARDSILLMQTIDISRYLKKGENIIAVWYAPGRIRNKSKQLSLELHGWYTDSVPFYHKADETWWCKPLKGCCYNEKEHFDNRIYNTEWKSAEYQSAGWVHPTGAFKDSTNYIFVDQLPYLTQNKLQMVLEPYQEEFDHQGCRIDFGRPFRGTIRLTIRNASKGTTLHINGNQYVCSGEMDEQAYYRIHAEHQKDFVITWDKGFRRSNITNIEGLEISE